MNALDPRDLKTIALEHAKAETRLSIAIAHAQRHAYATGVERGKELAKQAAIEAGTIPPTLCQTIHLGQPGVTVQSGHMLDPAGEEVATLTIASQGTEARLSFPTQLRASLVLHALMVPNEYLIVPVGRLQQVHRDLDACQKVIWHAGGFDPAYCRDAQERLKEIEGWLAKGVQTAAEAAADSKWHDEREEQSPELAAAIQAREEAISQVHGLKTQLRDLVAAAQPIINALAGPSHHIREMQATLKINENNPIIVLAKLCAAYRKQQEASHD